VLGLAVRVLVTLACALSTTLALVGPAEGAYRFSVPGRLHATAATSSTISLAWAPRRGARAYRVQYAATSSMRGAKYVRTTRASARLTRLQPSRRYYFRVRVINPRTGRAMSAYTRRTFPSARTTAAPASPSPLSWPSTTPAPGASTGSADVRVASFNIFGIHNDARATGEIRTWRERRPVVVRQILDQDVDVVGLQEANQSTIYPGVNYGSTQYADLRGAINATGAHYALTNEASYNCQKPSSSTSCVPVYRGASNSTRILYNTDTLDVVAQGSMRYAHQTAGKSDRYLVWGVFRVKATGGEFLFTTTHLDSYTPTVRVAQWNELIARVGQLRNGRPVVAVGDFNTTKYSTWAADLLPRMKSAGYGDVLDQQPGNSNVVSPRAQSRTNAWVNSYNGFRRDVKAYSYWENKTTKLGNSIDWVFASNELAVKEWETVIDHDPSTLRLTGVIPSDHNMVRATVVIP
jgi:endonuclease/exonuclease/phosphatase family metal-dependent hydrolase